MNKMFNISIKSRPFRIFKLFFCIVLITTGTSCQSIKASMRKRIIETETTEEVQKDTSDSVTAGACETDPFGNSITTFAEQNIPYFPLIAMIKSEEIYLYGIKGSNGMVLFIKGVSTYFNWPEMNPPYVHPQLMYNDFDRDGKNELAVVIHIGGGSNVSVSDLHIIKNVSMLNQMEYKDFSLLAENIIITEPIDLMPSEDADHFIFSFDNKTYRVNCYNNANSGLISGVIYDNHQICFEFEYDGIKFFIDVGAIYENYKTPHIFGYVSANVVFDGEMFLLTNYSFTLYK